MTKDYLPTNEAELMNWFQNWKRAMLEKGANFGFSPEEITQAEDDATVIESLITGSQELRVSESEYTEYKNIIIRGGENDPKPEFPTLTVPSPPTVKGVIKAGIIARTRAFVRRLKAAPDYNESVGADFRVLPAESGSVSPADAKPSLKVRALPDSKVEVTFVKGEFDGIELEMQRGGETVWMRVGRFIKSPAEDDTPPVTPNTPEQRRYRARYLLGNKAIGIYSDIYSVVTEP